MALSKTSVSKQWTTSEHFNGVRILTCAQFCINCILKSYELIRKMMEENAAF
jgi:hypothetical protein